jgi:hypothetical protein
MVTSREARGKELADAFETLRSALSRLRLSMMPQKLLD